MRQNETQLRLSLGDRDTKTVVVAPEDEEELDIFVPSQAMIGPEFCVGYKICM